jgi:hypothetical protein
MKKIVAAIIFLLLVCGISIAGRIPPGVLPGLFSGVRIGHGPISGDGYLLENGTGCYRLETDPYYYKME